MNSHARTLLHVPEVFHDNVALMRVGGLDLYCRRSLRCGLFRILGLGSVFIEARAFPELAGRLHWIDAGFLPPGCFIASPLPQPMMDSTKRDREFVAHLAPKSAGLQEAQMVRIRWLAAAN